MSMKGRLRGETVKGLVGQAKLEFRLIFEHWEDGMSYYCTYRGFEYDDRCVVDNIS